MTIRQRGKEGICESQFWIDGEFHQFTFNGEKGDAFDHFQASSEGA